MRTDHYLTRSDEHPVGVEMHCTCGWSSGGVNLMRHGLMRFRRHVDEESENARRPALGPDGGKDQ